MLAKKWLEASWLSGGEKYIVVSCNFPEFFLKNFYIAHWDINIPKHFIPHFLVGQWILVNSFGPLGLEIPQRQHVFYQKKFTLHIEIQKYTSLPYKPAEIEHMTCFTLEVSEKFLSRVLAMGRLGYMKRQYFFPPQYCHMVTNMWTGDLWANSTLPVKWNFNG